MIVPRLQHIRHSVFKFFQFVDLSLDLDYANLIHLLDDWDELYDLVDPSVHGQAEGALCGNTLVSVNHFLLHPDVPLVHLPDQIDIRLSYRAYVKLLQRLQKVFLLYLCFHFGPDFVQWWIVEPVHWSWHFGKAVLEDHDCENRLYDQMIWFDEVAQLWVLLEGLRWRPSRISDKFRQ